MSGIVAIAHGDGRPVDAMLLSKMTQSLAFRGPDAQEIEVMGSVGLGQTMLRSTCSAAAEKQPCSLDGSVWITADARIDDQAVLKKKLSDRGRINLEEATHCQLILHAYHVWGTNCVDQLMGDFAFAIWDGHEQRMFCARDHFGIKPLYYAHIGQTMIVSNTLDTVRLHPLVSAELNDLAIVNFILFGQQPKLDITSFADIQALLPAHTLVWETEKAITHQYWRLPVEDPLRFRRDEETIEAFRDLFTAAVQDRLPPGDSGILLSGGLDSTSVAATITESKQACGLPINLHAFTYSYEASFADPEPDFARLTADYLGLPITTIPQDNLLIYDGWKRPDFNLPEPSNGYNIYNWRQDLRKMGSRGIRVVFSGWGGDPLLYPEPSYAATMLHSGRIVELISDLVRSVRAGRGLPSLGLHSKLRSQRPVQPRYDEWTVALLNQELVANMDIPDSYWQLPYQELDHPWRPRAYAYMTGPYWPVNFARYDAEISAAPIEFRYPYFDLRVVRFILRLSAVRWCTKKGLLREGMAGRLPEQVLARPKATLAGDAPDRYPPWVDQFADPSPLLARYINTKMVSNLLPSRATLGIDPNLLQRLFALNLWFLSLPDRIEPVNN